MPSFQPGQDVGVQLAAFRVFVVAPAEELPGEGRAYLRFSCHVIEGGLFGAQFPLFEQVLVAVG